MWMQDIESSRVFWRDGGGHLRVFNASERMRRASRHQWSPQAHLFTLRLGAESQTRSAATVPTCTFWDETLEQWSEDGVDTHGAGDLLLSCATVHLTSFAVRAESFVKFPSDASDKQQLAILLEQLSMPFSMETACSPGRF